MDHGNGLLQALARFGEEGVERLADAFRERARGDGFARAHSRRARGVRIEQLRELVGVPVVRCTQSPEGGARLLQAPALDARLLREQLHQLLVLALQRGQLLELLLGESQTALQQRPRFVDDAARFRAHRGRVVHAPLVDHAARERLLQAVDPAAQQRVAIADEARVEALAR